MNGPSLSLTMPIPSKPKCRSPLSVEGSSGPSTPLGMAGAGAMLENHLFCRPAGRRSAVRIQGVVRRELLRHVVVVVLGHRREPRRQRVEAGRLRRELPGVGVRAAHNQREGTERRVVELVFLQERVERAALAMMTELHARDVVRDRALAFSNAHHLVLWHEQERRLLVDESADQPGTRDSIDACLLTGDPLHASPYLRLLVWSSAALRACASFTGSSFAQKCM